MSIDPQGAPEPTPGMTPAQPSPPSAPPPSAPPNQPAPDGGQTWSSPPVPAGPAPGILFAPYAGRLVAYIIDSLIIGFVVFAGVLLSAVPVIASRSGEPSGGAILATVLLFFLTLLVGLAYFPWFWVRWGSTPGMRLFRLRVVRDRDGGPVTVGAAILRLIGYWVSSAVFYIGFIWVFIDARRRGWHDLIAGTVVIEDSR